ncbi:unnamed protein product [Kuraishia capsulata CBS 1993]|uniref:Amino acid transporter transmembrane domain-containing protein n=1 Tax=Kuraishia capsulata CBS 1993 TaxID=1382522 RepID=W6MRM0_9ASCO|nr:uncharacterized protein KUCA_T00005399001 [Kuraishia capsulata CBS 1993]CDK29411.1 unnamed protein product [Kuraishia capsulata CBS 1993]
MIGASVNSSVVNLLNTIIGAGLLAIPYAIRTDGVVLGVLIVILSGIASGLGLVLQVLSSKFLPRGGSNFFTVCSITYPQLSVVFDIAIAIQCFGVGLSYIVLTGDLMPSIVEIDSFTHGQARVFWILLSLVIVLPLCYLRRLDSLKYASVVALVAIGYIVFIVYLYFFIGLPSGFQNVPNRGNISLWRPEGFKAIFSTFSIIVFAFTGHQNMYSIINELESPTLYRLHKIIIASISVAMALFVSVGLMGYFPFGDAITGNIILMYENTRAVWFAKLLLVLMVLISFPLMFHPCRISINNIAYWVETKWKTASDEAVPLLPGTATNPLGEKRFLILTTAILIASYVIAISLKSFELILSLVGATGSTAISFILPGLFGYKLINSTDPVLVKALEDNYPEYDARIFKSSKLRTLSLVLTVWGIISMFICLYASLFI